MRKFSECKHLNGEDTCDVRICVTATRKKVKFLPFYEVNLLMNCGWKIGWLYQFCGIDISK